jgi:ATP-dependent Clp endopeptidase proteolytic subunit ClpP
MIRNKNTFLAWMLNGTDQASANIDRLKALRKNAEAPVNFGVPFIVAKDNDEVEVYINDVIGGWWITEEYVISQIPKNAKKIQLFINSPGGDVFEGVSIYDFLERHQAEINVRVTGIAASMASIIALAGDTIIVPKSSFIMIHNPWTFMAGDAEDLEKEAILLRKIETGMAQLYAGKTGNDFEQCRQWMKDETWFMGEEATEYGFSDGTGEEDSDTASMMGQYNLSMFTNKSTNRVAMAPSSSTEHNQPIGDSDKMNEKLRKMLEAKGLATDATEDQAWEFLAKLDQKPDVDLEQVRSEAIRAEQDRQKEIRKMCRIARLEGNFTEKLIDDKVEVEAARQMVFDEMARTNPPVGANRIESGKTDVEKFSDAARDGMLMRAGVQIEKPAPGASEFRGFEMASIIRESMRRSGADVSGLNSRRAIADAVFNRRFGAHTTSDFPYIFRDAANKTLLKAYSEAPATWQPWVTKIPASDFKTIYGIALSEAPDTDLVNEAEEYGYGELKESQESYRVYKYGKILKLTFEMIINDDLRAFTRYPQLMGNAARRKESDLVYNLLTSGSNNHGPTMTDTYQLFKATNHLNLLATGRTISATNIDAAIQKMTAQTGLNGSTLDIQPRYLLVGPKNRLAARILFESAGYTEGTYNAGVINPMQNELQVIVENRLGAVFSGLGWYLVADPGMIDTFEVAYLDGYETPQITEHEEYKNDTIEWKIRQFFGVGAMEFRSMVLNDGTA